MRYLFFALCTVLTGLPAACQQAPPPPGTPSLGEQMLRDAIRRNLSPQAPKPDNLMALAKAPVRSTMPPPAKCAISLTEVPVNSDVDGAIVLRYQGSNDPKMILAPPPVCPNGLWK